MIRPGVGELLAGVAAQLDEDVVPELAPGSAARNQTRAAIAVLRRIAAVWDRVVPGLLDDVDDLETGLRAAADALAVDDPGRAALLEALEAVPDADATAGPYAVAATRHEQLQGALDRGLAGLDPANPATAPARAALLGAARRLVSRSRRVSGR